MQYFVEHLRELICFSIGVKSEGCCLTSNTYCTWSLSVPYCSKGKTSMSETPVFLSVLFSFTLDLIKILKQDLQLYCHLKFVNVLKTVTNFTSSETRTAFQLLEQEETRAPAHRAGGVAVATLHLHSLQSTTLTVSQKHTHLKASAFTKATENTK